MSAFEDVLATVVRKVLAEQTVSQDGPTRLSRLLKPDESATYLNISMTLLKRMIRKCDIPSVRVGRRVFIDRRDLDRWIESHKRGAVTNGTEGH